MKLKIGTMKTYIIKGETYSIEKVKGTSSGDIYYKVWRHKKFPEHDTFCGYWNSLSEIFKWVDLR